MRILFCFLFSSLAIAQPHTVHTYFKSFEHQLLGDTVLLELADGESAAAPVHKLTLPNTNKLTYGDIVALGGDFYGIPHAPISDGQSMEERMQRFKNAFSDLADEQPNYRCGYDFCANRILEVLAGETSSLVGHDFTQPMNERGPKNAIKLDYLTANNFLSLAIRNWDHFLPTSMLAYEAGHAAAIAQAKMAKTLATPQEQNAAVEIAYAMNAFADHFLTDMFSSGHLRVPRKELYDQSGTASMAGLLANLMHDEDGRVGLTVHNKAGTKWKMYGDGMLFIPGAKANLQQVSLAIATSVAEVAQAFKTGQSVAIEQFGVKNLVAELDDALLHPTTSEVNSSPLYSMDRAGRVLARIPQNSLCSYDWTSDWSGLSQWLGYRRGGDGSDCKFNAEITEHP